MSNQMKTIQDFGLNLQGTKVIIDIYGYLSSFWLIHIYITVIYVTKQSCQSMSNLLILGNIFYIENILLLRPLSVNVATIRVTSCGQYALLLPSVNFVFLFWFTFKLIIIQNGRE